MATAGLDPIQTQLETMRQSSLASAPKVQLTPGGRHTIGDLLRDSWGAPLRMTASRYTPKGQRLLAIPVPDNLSDADRSAVLGFAAQHLGKLLTPEAIDRAGGSAPVQGPTLQQVAAQHRGVNPAARFALQAAAGVEQIAPQPLTVPTDLVPKPKTAEEHIGRFTGQVATFGLETALLRKLPFLGPVAANPAVSSIRGGAAAALVAGAARAPDLSSRLIGAGVTGATAGLSEFVPLKIFQSALKRSAQKLGAQAGETMAAQHVANVTQALKSFAETSPGVSAADRELAARLAAAAGTRAAGAARGLAGAEAAAITGAQRAAVITGAVATPVIMGPLASYTEYGLEKLTGHDVELPDAADMAKNMGMMAVAGIPAVAGAMRGVRVTPEQVEPLGPQERPPGAPPGPPMLGPGGITPPAEVQPWPIPPTVRPAVDAIRKGMLGKFPDIPNPFAGNRTPGQEFNARFTENIQQIATQRGVAPETLGADDFRAAAAKAANQVAGNQAIKQIMTLPPVLPNDPDATRKLNNQAEATARANQIMAGKQVTISIPVSTKQGVVQVPTDATIVRVEMAPHLQQNSIRVLVEEARSGKLVPMAFDNAEALARAMRFQPSAPAGAQPAGRLTMSRMATVPAGPTPPTATGQGLAAAATSGLRVPAGPAGELPQRTVSGTEVEPAWAQGREAIGRLTAAATHIVMPQHAGPEAATRWQQAMESAKAAGVEIHPQDIERMRLKAKRTTTGKVERLHRFQELLTRHAFNVLQRHIGKVSREAPKERKPSAAQPSAPPPGPPEEPPAQEAVAPAPTPPAPASPKAEKPAQGPKVGERVEVGEHKGVVIDQGEGRKTVLLDSGRTVQAAEAAVKPEAPKEITHYPSASRGGEPLRISSMAGSHLVNAEAKQPAGPLKEALRAEMGKRGIVPKEAERGQPAAAPTNPPQPRAAAGGGPVERGAGGERPARARVPVAGEGGERISVARSEFTEAVDESGVPEDLRGFLTPYQRQGAAKALVAMRDQSRRAFLLADGTGVGKTRQILTVAETFRREGRLVVVFTPNEVLGKPWESKSMKAAGGKPTVTGSYAQDSAAMGISVNLWRPKDGPMPTSGIVLTTYTYMTDPAITENHNAVYVFDESHALKNASAGTRLAVKGRTLGNASYATLFASATPADKPTHIEYLARIGILEGKTLRDAVYDLGFRLAEKGGRTFWVPQKGIKTEEILKRMSALFDRMTQKGSMVKREIGLDGVDIHFRRLAMPRSMHQTLATIAANFDESNPRMRAIMLMHQRRQQEPEKAKVAMEIAKREIAAGRRVILFVSRVNFSEVQVTTGVDRSTGEKIRETIASSEGTAKLLREMLKKDGIPFAELHGDADVHAAEAMASFQTGDAKVLVATVESGGTGINLDDTTGDAPRTLIMVTAPFNGVTNVQAAGRVWRMTTKSLPRIVYLFGDTPVDDWNAAIIAKKMETLGANVSGQVKRLLIDPDLLNETEPEDIGSLMAGEIGGDMREPEPPSAVVTPEEPPPPEAGPPAKKKPRAARIPRAPVPKELPEGEEEAAPVVGMKGVVDLFMGKEGNDGKGPLRVVGVSGKPPDTLLKIERTRGSGKHGKGSTEILAPEDIMFDDGGTSGMSPTRERWNEMAERSVGIHEEEPPPPAPKPKKAAPIPTDAEQRALAEMLTRVNEEPGNADLIPRGTDAAFEQLLEADGWVPTKIGKGDYWVKGERELFIRGQGKENGSIVQWDEDYTDIERVRRELPAPPKTPAERVEQIRARLAELREETPPRTGAINLLAGELARLEAPVPVEPSPAFKRAAEEFTGKKFKVAKPLEQTTLGSLPAPQIPGGAKPTGPAPALELAGEAQTFEQAFEQLIKSGETPAFASLEAARVSGQNEPQGFDAERVAGSIRRRLLEEAGQGDLFGGSPLLGAEGRIGVAGVPTGALKDIEARPDIVSNGPSAVTDENVPVNAIGSHTEFQNRDTRATFKGKSGEVPLRELVNPSNVEALYGAEGGFNPDLVRANPPVLWRDTLGELGTKGRLWILSGHHRVWMWRQNTPNVPLPAKVMHGSLAQATRIAQLSNRAGVGNTYSELARMAYTASKAGRPDETVAKELKVSESELERLQDFFHVDADLRAVYFPPGAETAVMETAFGSALGSQVRKNPDVFTKQVQDDFLRRAMGSNDTPPLSVAQFRAAMADWKRKIADHLPQERAAELLAGGGGHISPSAWLAATERLTFDIQSSVADAHQTMVGITQQYKELFPALSKKKRVTQADVAEALKQQAQHLPRHVRAVLEDIQKKLAQLKAVEEEVAARTQKLLQKIMDGTPIEADLSEIKKFIVEKIGTPMRDAINKASKGGPLGSGMGALDPIVTWLLRRAAESTHKAAQNVMRRLGRKARTIYVKDHGTGANLAKYELTMDPTTDPASEMRLYRAGAVSGIMGSYVSMPPYARGEALRMQAARDYLPDFWEQRLYEVMGDDFIRDVQQYYPGDAVAFDALEKKDTPAAQAMLAKYGRQYAEVRTLLNEIRDYVKKVSEAAGVEAPGFIENYAPHVFEGTFARGIDTLAEFFHDRKMDEEEKRQLAKRFFDHREGDENYRRSFWLALRTYVRFSGHYVAKIRFLSHMKQLLSSEWGKGDPQRAAEVRRATVRAVWPAEDSFGRFVNDATRAAFWSRVAGGVDQITQQQAAAYLGRERGELAREMIGDEYANRFAYVLKGVKPNFTDPRKWKKVGDTKYGAVYAGTGGHAFGPAHSELMPWIQKMLDMGLELKVRSNRKVTPEDAIASMLRQRDRSTRLSRAPGNYLVSWIGRRISRALVGLSAATTLINFTGLLTHVYTRYGALSMLRGGARFAAGSSISAVRGLAAYLEHHALIDPKLANAIYRSTPYMREQLLLEAGGLKQGFSQSLEKMLEKIEAGQHNIDVRIAQLAGNWMMGAELLIRGWSVMAAADAAESRGHTWGDVGAWVGRSSVDRNRAIMDLMGQLSDPKSVISYAAENEYFTNFYYNQLGQNPGMGIPWFKTVLGLFSTFPWSSLVHKELRGMMGASKAVSATIRSALGRPYKETPMRGSVQGSNYEAPRMAPREPYGGRNKGDPFGPFAEFFRKGGMSYFDRQAAIEFARSMFVSGALAVASAVMGINALVAYTPYAFLLGLAVLKMFYPDNEELAKVLKNAEAGTAFRAGHGGLVAGAPIINAIEQTRAGDSWGQVLWNATLGRMGDLVRMAFLGKFYRGARGVLEQNPEIFDTDERRWLYDAFNVKSALYDLTPQEKALRTLGLLDESVAEEHRQFVHPRTRAGAGPPRAPAYAHP